MCPLPAESEPLAPAQDTPPTFSLLSFPVHTRVTDKAFMDVLDDLRMAISGQNFRLTEQAQIGEAIAKRDGIAFPKLSILHFCNLAYARRLLELAPQLSLRMPCRISVRELVDGQVELQVLLLPEDSGNTELDQFAETLNGILLDIVGEGAS